MGSEHPMAPHVVIAGGGFAGFHTARALERVLPADGARITLVNDVNFLLWTPLLPGAASGALEPRHAVVGLREHLKRTDLRLGRVRSADPGRRELHVHTIAGHEATVRYDRLVVAVGSISKTLPIPGLEEHGLGFKTLADGIALRQRLLRQLEIAETLEDEDERASYLAFVFVGGGYAGVEGLAELQDLALEVLDEYPRCRAQGTRWLLIEAADHIMGEVHQRLGDYTAAELQRRGIEVRTGTTVEEVQAESIRLSDGEVVPTRALVWTAGVRPQPVVEELGLPLRRAASRSTGSAGSTGTRTCGRSVTRPPCPTLRSPDNRARRPRSTPSGKDERSPATSARHSARGRRARSGIARWVCSSISGGARPWRRRSASAGAERRRGRWRAATTWRRCRGSNAVSGCSRIGALPPCSAGTRR